MSAVLSSDGKMLRIYGVNSTTKGLPLKLRLADFPSSIAEGTLHILKDRDGSLSSEVMNSRDDPNRIVSVSRTTNIKGNECEFLFEPLSMVLLELRLEK